MSVHSVAQLCLTLCDPMDWSPPGPSVHGILQARTLAWVAMLSSSGSSWPRGQTWVSCIAGGFFTIWARREALWIKVAFFNSSYLHVISLSFSLIIEFHGLRGVWKFWVRLASLFYTTGHKPPRALVFGHHSATTWSNCLAQWLGTLSTSVQFLVQNTHCKKQTNDKKNPTHCAVIFFLHSPVSIATIPQFTRGIVTVPSLHTYFEE